MKGNQSMKCKLKATCCTISSSGIMCHVGNAFLHSVNDSQNNYSNEAKRIRW